MNAEDANTNVELSKFRSKGTTPSTAHITTDVFAIGHKYPPTFVRRYQKPDFLLFCLSKYVEWSGVRLNLSLAWFTHPIGRIKFK
ncbi:hypothetical protein GQ457_01G037470 [Hibiscus cannabinus]